LAVLAVAESGTAKRATGDFSGLAKLKEDRSITKSWTVGI